MMNDLPMLNQFERVVYERENGGQVDQDARDRLLGDFNMPLPSAVSAPFQHM